MSRPLPVRVVLPRVGSDGAARFVADLEVATTLARWVASGAPVRLWTGSPSGTTADWVGQVRRGASRVLVVPRRQHDPDAAWHADVLEADLVPAAQLEETLTRLFPGHTPERSGGRPYAQGILSTDLASEVGLDGSSPDVVDELHHVSSRMPTPGSIPVVRFPLGTDRAAAQRRESLTEIARRSGTDLVPVLAPEHLSLAVARCLRSSQITAVRLEARAQSAQAVRAAQVVAALAHLATSVRLDLGTVADLSGQTARQVAELVAVRPDLEVLATAAQLRAVAARAGLVGVLPASGLAQTVRQDSRRGQRARERMVAGHYSDIPLVGGPHDVWWDHVDHPEQHREWLSTLIPVGGHLHLSARHDVSAWTAPIQVSDYREITPYRDLAPDTVSALAVLATPECISTFLADAESAWRTGTAPTRFRTADVAGLCAVGASCWSAGGRRLHVDASGTVRCRPAGPVIGHVGDTFAQLRRVVRGGAGCRAAVELPPWMPRVLSAREALRALVPSVTAGSVGQAEVRSAASGLGGPLLHTLGRATQWPAGLALIAVNDEHLAHHAGHRTTARLSRGQAAALEISLDLGTDAAPVLSELRQTTVTTHDVSHLVGSLLDRLAGTSRTPTTLPAPARIVRPSHVTPAPQLATAHQG